MTYMWSYLMFYDSCHDGIRPSLLHVMVSLDASLYLDFPEPPGLSWPTWLKVGDRNRMMMHVHGYINIQKVREQMMPRRPCYVMLCYVMLCYVILCYIILCHVMSRYVMICYVMLCHIISYHLISSLESHELLSRITDVIIPYLIGQVRAGAQMLEVFDSWAGDLTPALFREFSLPYLKVGDVC